MRTMTATALALLLLPAGASAQDAAEAGRFRLERSESGMVRLDTRTGAMSLCRENDGNLLCRMAADERAAYEEQLDRLERRVEALEAASGRSGALSRKDELPTDAEIDRSIGIMERFMRSFFGMVKEFEGEAEPAPEKPL